jgi:release factor glutamine methyltransferase
MSAITRESQKTWRVIDILKWGETYFSEVEFENPRREIEVFVQEILACKRVDLYLRFDEPLTKNQLTTLRDWIKRRKDHEPPQYITGKAGFYNIELIVNPDVLIPRPESEVLVEQVLKRVSESDKLSILDIGTGSGSIALAIANERPNCKIVGIDNSDKAIELAKSNSQNLGFNNVEFLCIDILSEEIDEQFDIIVSNPPYIPKLEMSGLMPEVHNFEPHSALTDNADGLIFYRKFIEISNIILKAGGWFLLEVGLGEHPKIVKNLFNKDKFDNVELIKDLNGDDRVLVVRLK